ncbi:AVN_collapsed_G0046690.mRNA.1.CDS.1 [Saccharomyces cerevisiae]|nr:AVN_collapsed_G0046690.mRNA.1.CDS.1 [Saccharomyces cerevisiae]
MKASEQRHGKETRLPAHRNRLCREYQPNTVDLDPEKEKWNLTNKNHLKLCTRHMVKKDIRKIRSEENVHYQFPNNVKTFTHPIVIIETIATKRTGHDSFLPIIIYHANANHGNASNTSTFKIGT